MTPLHAKNLLNFVEKLKVKNKIRDKFKKERISSVTPTQKMLVNALGEMSHEFSFGTVKEREIYTQNGVRFADIYIKKYGLIIEVDGGYHSSPDQRIKDIQRDEEVWKEKQIITLRFTNDEIENQLENVLTAIRLVVSKLDTLSNFNSMGKGKKKLHNTLERKKIYNQIIDNIYFK